MRVCIIGSSDIHIQKWVQWFHQRGHTTYWITTLDDKIDGVHIFHIDKKRGLFNLILRIIQTIKTVKKLKPDIVNAHYISATETIAAALSNYHPFVILAMGSDIAIDSDKSIFHNIFIKFVLKRADIVHTGDEYGKRRLMELGCDEKKIIISPWGVNFFHSDSGIRPLEKMNKYIVLSPRTWYQKNNVDLLIKAAPNVIKKIKEVSFIFIGGGPLEKELKTLSENLGVMKNIVLVGRIPYNEIYNYLIDTDILVDTLRFEEAAGGGIGVTNMEAMLCGVPLLLAEREYLKKVGKSLQDEPWYCSLVYNGNNPQDLADKIIQLLVNEKLRKDIGLKEKMVAREIGDWNKNMSQIEHLMLELLKK
jgi:L-malate glycosyltransferase